MAWQGGSQGQFGDRVHNGHDYYPKGFNKVTTTGFAKGNVLYADPTDAFRLRLGTVGDVGPFYVAYAATIASDPRQHCWHDEGNWLVLQATNATIRPNSLVIPDTGKVKERGADVTTGVLGVCQGSIDMHAELTSNNVIQDTVPANGYAVIKIMNIVRLPTV